MAFESPVIVEPVFDATNFTFLSDQPDGLLPCHREVSLMELISLVDSRKCRVISNSPIQYVHALPNSQLLFKRVETDSDISFKVQDGNDAYNYEEVETYVSRFYKKINGMDILLAEFAIWYDYLGKQSI